MFYTHRSTLTLSFTFSADSIAEELVFICSDPLDISLEAQLTYLENFEYMSSSEQDNRKLLVNCTTTHS